jgi:hypothetical protein
MKGNRVTTFFSTFSLPVFQQEKNRPRFQDSLQKQDKYFAHNSCSKLEVYARLESVFFYARGQPLRRRR